MGESAAKQEQIPACKRLNVQYAQTNSTVSLLCTATKSPGYVPTAVSHVSVCVGVWVDRVIDHKQVCGCYMHMVALFCSTQTPTHPQAVLQLLQGATDSAVHVQPHLP